MNRKTIIASAIVLSLGLVSCSEQKTPEQHIASAQSLMDEQEVNAAIIELKNAVKIAPKLASARAYLGHAYLQQGQYLGAEKELEKAIDLGGLDEQIIADLAFIKFKLNKHEALYKVVDEAGQLSDRSYLAVLAYAVGAAISENDLDRANDYLEQARGINAESNFTKLAQAYMQYAKSQYEEGLIIVNDLLDDAPNFHEALLMQGDFLFAQEKYEQASHVYADYIRQHPQAYETYFLEASSLLRNNDYQSAEPKVNQLLKRFEDAPLSNEYKSQIEYFKEDFESAKLYADKALQLNSQLIISKIIAGASSFNLSNYEQAYGYLVSLEQYLPLSHPVIKMLAIVRIKLGYSADSTAMYENLDNLSVGDVNFLQVTSEELLEAGDFENARKLIEKAAELAPENTNVAIQKSRLLLSQDQKASISALEQVIKLEPTLTEAELLLAIQYIDDGQLDKAIAIANSWVGTEENKISGLFLLGLISEHENKTQIAKQHYLNVLSIEPENSAVLYRLADIANQAKDYQLAIEYYQKVVAILPSHEPALLMLSNIRHLLKESQLNVDFLEKLNAQHPNNIVLMLNLAQNYRLNNQLSKAISMLEALKNRKELPVAYWTILGDAYLQAKNMIQAQVSFEKALELEPKHLVAGMRKVGILEYNKKYQEGLAYVNFMMEQHPKSDYLLLLKTNFELLVGDITNAKLTLLKLKEKNTNHYLVDKYTGEIALLEKKYDVAINHFNTLYEKKSTGLNAMLLARTLKFNGQKHEAAAVLESYLDGMVKDHKVRMLLAELYMQFDELKAINHLEIINDDVQGNVVVLNNLAMLELNRGEAKKSLEYAKQAFELKPNMYQVLDTYGVSLIENNQFKQAIPILEKAIAQGSIGESTYVALAKAYISEGKNEKINILLDSIKSKSTFEKVMLIVK